MSGFGGRLRRARKGADLTLEALGEKIGSSKAYVWQLENKESASPSGDLLMKLCAALNKEPSYFLGLESAEGDELATKEILFRKFSALDARDRDIVLALIEKMNVGDADS